MSLDITLVMDQCDHCKRGDEIVSFNITHNLGKMASNVIISYNTKLSNTLYDYLWDEKTDLASDMIEPLTQGLSKLKDDPEYYKQFESPNGWGTYKYFVPFVEKVLNACIQYPDTKIRICK